MSAHRRRSEIRTLVGALVLALIGSTGAAAEERATGALPPHPLPAPVLTTGLSADTPLPVDVVPLAALSAPPAHGEAGGMLLQGGGGGPRFRYYGLDALGSVRVVFDAAGAVVSRADYEPFGAAASTTTGPQPREQYTGHERDGEVGVDYFGARLYLAALGRMPSVDPLYVGAVEDPQRWNRYAYALNSPIVMVDPDGRTTKCTGTTTIPGSELGACSDGGAKGGRSSRPPGGPAFSFGVSTIEFFGFSSNETYFIAQYGYIPEFGSQTVDFPAAKNAKGEVFSAEADVQAQGAANQFEEDMKHLEVMEAGAGGAAATAAKVVSKYGSTAANRLGQHVHAAYRALARAKDGWAAEVTMKGASGNTYRVDIVTKRGYILEIKPKTASGVARGATQSANYARELERKVRVIYYDPAMWIP